jgi:hypothetical protein
MGKSFATKVREKQVIDFDIDGEPFTFTPPKRAGLIASVVSSVGLDGRATDTDSVRDLLNWMGDGLPEAQKDRVIERLNDPEDDFDLDTVNDIARYLLGQSSGRPTKRRSG